MKELIAKALAEAKEYYKDDPGMTEEDIRVVVYENLRDDLKYYFSDVAYG